MQNQKTVKNACIDWVVASAHLEPCVFGKECVILLFYKECAGLRVKVVTSFTYLVQMLETCESFSSFCQVCISAMQVDLHQEQLCLICDVQTRWNSSYYNYM